MTGATVEIEGWMMGRSRRHVQSGADAGPESRAPAAWEPPMATLSAALARPLFEVAAQRGAPLSMLVREWTSERTTAREAGRRVPVEPIFDAWETTKAATRDDAVALMAAERTSLERHGTLGFLLYTSTSIREAIDVLVRYHALLDDSATWVVELREDGAVVRLLRAGAASPGRTLANEHLLATVLHLLRETLGGALAVAEAWLERTAPADGSRHRRCFGDAIRWSSAGSAFRLGAAALEARPRGANPMLHRHFVACANAELEAGLGAWSTRTARAAAATLSAGIPTVADIAKILGLNERTLRRRLKEEGIHFADIVAKVQGARARELLAQGTPVRDVALATGFADPTAFARAFRRWTGAAPSSTKIKA